MSVIHIRNLADAPQHVEEVSRWLWEQWARADGYSLEDIVYRTRHAMGGAACRRCSSLRKTARPSAWSPSGTMTPKPGRISPRGSRRSISAPTAAAGTSASAAGRLYRGRPRHRHL